MEQGLPKTSQRSHHPCFYDPDGKIVFCVSSQSQTRRFWTNIQIFEQAGHYYFRTNPHSLRLLSEVFEGMFVVGTEGQDGSMDEKAIPFHDDEQDVCALFNWMTKLGYETFFDCETDNLLSRAMVRPQPPPLEEWISVLKMSTKYFIKTGYAESVYQIEQSALPPSCLFHLGLSYSVPHWIQKAMTSMLDVPLPHFNDADYTHLPPAVIRRIVSASWETTKVRLALFNKPPAIHHTESCSSPNCGSSWPSYWSKAAAILTLCPGDIWVSGQRVLDALGRTEIAGLNTACKSATRYMVTSVLKYASRKES